MSSIITTSEQAMIQCLTQYIKEVVENPEDYDFKDTALAKQLLDDHKNNTAAFAETIAKLVFCADVDFTKPKFWEAYFDDMPWVGAVIQTCWDSMNWELVYKQLPQLKVKKFLKALE